MRYSGLQPQYFPRLHYFARILNADIFMLRDEAQFVRKHKYPDGKTHSSYQSYTEIKAPEGVLGLRVSLAKSGYVPIHRVAISYTDPWLDSHLATIEHYYKKSPYFPILFAEIKRLLTQKYSSLAELNIATISWAIQYLFSKKKYHQQVSLETVNQLLQDHQIRLKQIKKSTGMPFMTADFDQLTADEKIIRLMQSVGATEDYCGGTALAAYVNRPLYQKHGFTLTQQQWLCPQYHQQFTHRSGFIPNLSIIDLLMNEPKEKALQILIHGA